MIGGLCITGAALVFLFLPRVPMLRQAGGQRSRLATARRTGSMRQDWCLGALWFGLLIVSANQAFQQVQRSASTQEIMFTLAAVAAGAFGCGVGFGRALLRRQWLLEAAQESSLDRLSGKAQPRRPRTSVSYWD